MIMSTQLINSEPTTRLHELDEEICIRIIESQGVDMAVTYLVMVLDIPPGEASQIVYDLI